MKANHLRTLLMGAVAPTYDTVFYDLIRLASALANYTLVTLTNIYKGKPFMIIWETVRRKHIDQMFRGKWPMCLTDQFRTAIYSGINYYISFSRFFSGCLSINIMDGLKCQQKWMLKF